MKSFGFSAQGGMVILSLIIAAGLIGCMIWATVKTTTRSGGAGHLRGWQWALLGVPCLFTVAWALPGTLNNHAAVPNLGASALSGPFGALCMARVLQARAGDVKAALIILVVGGTTLLWLVLAALIAGAIVLVTR